MVLGDSFSPALIDSVSKAIHHTYSAKVIYLGTHDMPKTAFVNLKSPRYRADTLLNHLHQFLGDSLEHVMALTHFDISCTSRDKEGNIKKPEWKYQDWGIFGYAGRPGKTAVVSDFRIGKPSNPKYLDRLMKICIHELGHNLALPHCPNKACVMRDAVEKLSSIDHENAELCSACQTKIN